MDAAGRRDKSLVDAEFYDQPRRQTVARHHQQHDACATVSEACWRRQVRRRSLVRVSRCRAVSTDQRRLAWQ